MTPGDVNIEGLSKFETMVVRELEKNALAIDKLRDDFSNLRLSQREIKIKSSLWGSLAAIMTTLAAFGGSYLYQAIRH